MDAEGASSLGAGEESDCFFSDSDCVCWVLSRSIFTTRGRQKGGATEGRYREVKYRSNK